MQRRAVAGTTDTLKEAIESCRTRDKKTAARTQHHKDMHSKERYVNQIPFPSPYAGDRQLRRSRRRHSIFGIFGSYRSIWILCHSGHEAIGDFERVESL